MKKGKELIKKLIYGEYKNINEINRDKWVISQLNKIPNGYKILDVGAGECKYKKYCSHLKYKSQDFCQYSGGAVDDGLQTGQWDTSQIDIISDILEIPVEDNSYDVILCTEVFEHVPHPELAIKEFNRILRKGGVLILTAPFSSWTHFAPYHYCTGFNSYWYEYHLSENGFKMIKCVPNGDYYLWIRQEINRLTYSKNGWYSPSMVIGARLINRYLKKCNSKSNNLESLGCFGYHVVAKKA